MSIWLAILVLVELDVWGSLSNKMMHVSFTGLSLPSSRASHEIPGPVGSVLEIWYDTHELGFNKWL